MTKFGYASTDKGELNIAIHLSLLRVNVRDNGTIFLSE
jgi:hypothetical protein